jgi:ribose transport system substrate-binding protein
MKIAVFTKNRINPAYAAARLGAERVAARFAATVTHYVPQQPDDAAEQTAQVEAALLARPEAIVITPVHPQRIDAVLKKAAAAGIPVFGFISDLQAQPWRSFVGSDDRKLGEALATAVFGHLGGEGAVVFVQGSFDSKTAVDRAAGFADAAARFPGIRVAASCGGRYDFEASRVAVSDLLPRLPEIDAIIAANDMMALGAIAALRAAGRMALVAGINAIPEAVKAIRRGEMIATADFNAMNLAAIATECALRHLGGENVPRRVMLPVQIVDAGNALLWDAPFEDRPQITWADAVAGSTPG